ncbi:hypothetical protein AB6A40_010866 [Gnathostoma spinigerum]|uniref:Uncharacterized protein n=1 Tax=Gnathostoma spinigerum TaxID=75299 RepID=A0ABD6F3J1_9BILA
MVLRSLILIILITPLTSALYQLSQCATDVDELTKQRNCLIQCKTEDVCKGELWATDCVPLNLNEMRICTCYCKNDELPEKIKLLLPRGTSR